LVLQPSHKSVVEKVTDTTSPTNKASAGRFTTAVDNTLDWGGATVDNWLAFAGWDNDLFSLGYARKIGGIYLGAWYNGNVVASGETDTDFVRVDYDAFGNPTDELGGYVVAEQPWAYSNNRLGVLLGIAGMGFKLDVRENYLSKDAPLADFVYLYNEDKEAGTKTVANEVSDYKYVKGWTDIYAGWGGLSLALGGLTLKPSAKLGVQLYADDQYAEFKGSQDAGGYVYTDTALASTQQGWNSSFVRPNIAVAASLGGLPAGLGVSLEYAINFDLYTSSYDLYGGSGSVAGDVGFYAVKYSQTTPSASTSQTSRSVQIEEKTRIAHDITPALTYSTDLGDRAKFGLKLNLPFALGSKTSGGTYSETWGTSTSKPNGGVETKTETHEVKYQSGESETSTFGFAPKLSLGVQFAAIPDKLTFNFGVASGFAYDSEKTLTKPAGVGYKTEKVTEGNLVQKDEKTAGPIGSKVDTSYVKKGWSDLNAAISAGFSFQFSPNFLLDTYYTSDPDDHPTKAGESKSTGISFGETSFWEDIVAGKFALMFTIKK
jgi:hypothetical protein